MLALLAVGGMVLMMAILLGLATTAARSDQRQRRRDEWEELEERRPRQEERRRPLRQGEQIEFVCAGMCIASRGETLTGAYREAEYLAARDAAVEERLEVLTREWDPEIRIWKEAPAALPEPARRALPPGETEVLEGEFWEAPARVEVRRW